LSSVFVYAAECLTVRGECSGHLLGGVQRRPGKDATHLRSAVLCDTEGTALLRLRKCLPATSIKRERAALGGYRSLKSQLLPLMARRMSKRFDNDSSFCTPRISPKKPTYSGTGGESLTPRGVDFHENLNPHLLIIPARGKGPSSANRVVPSTILPFYLRIAVLLTTIGILQKPALTDRPISQPLW